MYLTGMGTEQDLNEAMRWFLKAKSHGADVTRQVAAVMEERKMQNVHHSHKTRIPEPTPGAEVEVTGLVTRPELNGVRGKVVRHISDKDRWEVVLNNGYGIAALKTVNLHVM